MNPPSPPPKLPKDKESRDPFQRWLYTFWTWVTGSVTDADQNILAVRAFSPRYQITPPPLVNDSQQILVNQIFGG